LDNREITIDGRDRVLEKVHLTSPIDDRLKEVRCSNKKKG
jgi:hypothetical protein